MRKILKVYLNFLPASIRMTQMQITRLNDSAQRYWPLAKNTNQKSYSFILLIIIYIQTLWSSQNLSM